MGLGGNMSDAKGMSFKGGKAGSEIVHYSRHFTLKALKNHFNWGAPRSLLSQNTGPVHRQLEALCPGCSIRHLGV